MTFTDDDTCAGTQDISASTVEISGKVVTLIDTPGFDDTERSDADILESISEYLLETYAQKILLTGVILLQPITGNRVKGSEKKRLRLFQKILGEAAFSHVVIATTMWSELNSNVDGESRVTERMSDYWRDLLDGGAKVVNHDNTPERAVEIIEMLVEKGAVTLRMQEELERNNGHIKATAAGQQLISDYGDDKKKLLAMIEKLHRQLQEEQEKREELEEEIREGPGRHWLQKRGGPAARGSQGGGGISASLAGCCHWWAGLPDVQSCVCHPFQKLWKTCCALRYSAERQVPSSDSLGSES